MTQPEARTPPGVVGALKVTVGALVYCAPALVMETDATAEVGPGELKLMLGAVV